MSCAGECVICVSQAVNHPVGDDYILADDIMTKYWTFQDAGMMVQQHKHAFDHTSFIISGAVRVWIDGILQGEHRAPSPIFIKAGVKHMFETLKPNTIILCIHNVSRTGHIEIVEDG